MSVFNRIDLSRGKHAWIEGPHHDIAINDPSQHALIVLTQEEFERIDELRQAAKRHP